MKRAALLVGLALAGCGGGGDGSSDAEAKRWLTQYIQYADSMKRAAEAAEEPARRGDLDAAGRHIRRLGRQADQVRVRFRNVPRNLTDGEEAYELLVDAADAAQQWALIYKTNPPPYPQTADGLSDGQAMSDAAVEFQQRFREMQRFLADHEDEPLTTD